MTTEFTMYSGLHTIGGVIFSLTYGKERLLFEFGTSYDPACDIYDRYVEARKTNKNRDAIKIGAAPRIDGIYRKEDCEGLELISAEESEFHTTVFISHLHLDHMSCIGMLDKSVDVYMNPSAQLLLHALEDTGEGVGFRFENVHNFETEVPVHVGPFIITPIIAKSSSFKDFSFLIQTPDGTIHYTGDLILHHTECENTWHEMELVKQAKPDILLCDTTAFMDSVLSLMIPDCDPKKIKPSKEIPEPMISEKEMHQQMDDTLKAQKGLCVFNFYQREMLLADWFIKHSEQAGRICAFEPDTAYMVYKFFKIKPNVYIPDSFRYTEECAKPWFKELLKNCRIITLDMIKKEPSHYVIQNSYRHILELFSLPDTDAAYLHAEGTPIGKFDPAYENMHKIIRKTNFNYITFFCSTYFGHGYPCMVKYYVDEIDPPILIPCHSYNPERLLPKNGIQFLPELNQTYLFENGKLKKKIVE